MQSFKGFGSNYSASRIDVNETENEIVASCSLPGLESEDDVKVEARNNILTIRGNVNRMDGAKGEMASQQVAGSFQQSVSLPSSVSKEDIKKEWRNGILEIRIPKKKKEEDIGTYEI